MPSKDSLQRRLAKFAETPAADVELVRKTAGLEASFEEAAAFLSASSGEVASAASALAAAREVRASFGRVSIAEIAPFMRAPTPERARPDGCLVLLEDMKGGVARDPHGRPIVWSIGMQHGSAAEMQRQMVYVMDRAATYALPHMPPHAICMVIDVVPRERGAPATFRFPDREVRTLFDLQGRLLPGAAYSTTHFCGLPSFVTFAFRLVRPFMSAAAYDSMVLKPSFSHLSKELSADCRLAEWAGGSLAFDVDAYVEWRAREEGVQPSALCARGHGRAFNAKAAAAAAAAALRESLAGEGGGADGGGATHGITAKALIEGGHGGQGGGEAADAVPSSHPAAASNKPAVRHGEVSKRGSGRGLFSTVRWKKKLLVLIDGALVYFDSTAVDDANTADAIVPLDAGSAARRCDAASSDRKGPTAQFTLSAAGRDFLFGVGTDADADGWVADIGARIEAIRATTLQHETPPAAAQSDDGAAVDAAAAAMIGAVHVS